MRAVLRSIPAPVLFVLGGLSMYVGAALAVGLFDRLAPSAVAVMRLIGAAAVLLAWRRPSAAAWRGRRFVRATAFGLATGLMNLAFYEAIARLPLGTAVAIEFCGPVAVAAVTSRRARDVAAVLLAAAGVLLIADVRWSAAPGGWCGRSRPRRCGRPTSCSARGWPGRQRGRRHGRRLRGRGGAALAGAVPRQSRWARDARRPGRAGAGLGVGVLSSVVPYVLDQVVLRRVGTARFAVLLALLPATATIVGLVLLAQLPGPAEAVGIAAVVAAVALRSRDGDPPPRSLKPTTQSDTRPSDAE